MRLTLPPLELPILLTTCSIFDGEMNTPIVNRRKILIFGLVLLAAASYGFRTMTKPQWTTITSTFMKEDKPYGGGAFRLRGNEVMTLKLADPEVRYRVVGLDKGYDEAQAVPEEPWMDDTAELLNRSTAKFLRGTLDGGMARFFLEPAQNAAWWYSKDWKTLYVATDWMDYKHRDPKGGLSPHIAKLWRSGDGGKTWAQLKWPEDHNVNDLYFLDSQRGYAIGWGPHIWRTSDGGQSWQEIPPPPMATDDHDPRETFSAAALGPDGTLRVACPVRTLGENRSSSVVYQLRWAAAHFDQEVVLEDQLVVRLGSTDELIGNTYSIYALSRLGSPRDANATTDSEHRMGAISTWSSAATAKADQLHVFDQRYELDGLSVGTKGVLLVYATDTSLQGAPHDITFYSRDSGRSWSDIDDGIGQGGWFDPQTNTQYALYANTLKKRQF
jgi:hypothetical protein